MKAVEPEVIFQHGLPNSGPGIETNRTLLQSIAFGVKVFLAGTVGVFIALLIMICFPISALCTLCTIISTTTRLITTYLAGLFKKS